ncbi:MAG: agenet domain-containing protein, partial [Chitinophagales bacterium]
MKQFSISHSLIYFAFILFFLNSPFLLAQRTAKPSHKKGDKIEVKVNIDGKDVWLAATVAAVESNGKYKVQVNTTQTFNPNSVRKIPAPKPANTGGGQATNSKPANTGGGQATNSKPANTGGGQATNSKPANAKPASYKANDKVEVEISYKGGKIWVEGTYMQEFGGKHMAQFKFKYGSGSDFFTANQIRPFTGNLTPLNTGGGGAATGGGNA